MLYVVKSDTHEVIPFGSLIRDDWDDYTNLLWISSQNIFRYKYIPERLHLMMSAFDANPCVYVLKATDLANGIPYKLCYQIIESDRSCLSDKVRPYILVINNVPN